MDLAPVARPIIPFHCPVVGPEEAEAVAQAVRDGRLAGNGPIGRQVEARLRTVLGGPSVLLTSSCTGALELALLALGIGPGMEVILPSFTFVSCATAVVRCGARPVFVEIEPETLALDPDAVRRAITSRTRALLVVHYGGFPGRLEALLAVAAHAGVPVIEDAAHAFGSSWRGRPLGTIGDLGCLSFHGTKPVTCGEGGALIARAPELAARALIMREKGTNREAFLQGAVDHYTWCETGGSFVLSDVLAALLGAQLDRLAVMRQARQAIGQRYLETLAPLAAAGRLALPRVSDPSSVNWHLFYTLWPTAEACAEALAALQAAGIDARPHFVPLHSAPYARRRYGYRPEDLPVTESVARRLLRLPLYPGLAPEAQALILETIHQVAGS